MPFGSNPQDESFPTLEQARNAAVGKMDKFLGWEKKYTTAKREKTKHPGVIAVVWRTLTKWARLRYDASDNTFDLEMSEGGHRKGELKTVHFRVEGDE